jgi:3',5'-cyclic AMP phosphodiesterase CpdA
MNDSIVKKMFIFALPLAFVISCSSVSHVVPDGKEGDKLFIWAFSDIQPRNMSERSFFEIGVKDARENFPPIDIAIVAGDIVQVGGDVRSSSDYTWFLGLRSTVNVGSWYEIAGNHDARNLDNYKKYTGKPLHYSVLIGNILMLFLSDEDGNTSGTEVSSGAFEWWKKAVIDNQDKIIITVTHSHLADVGFPYAVIGYRNVIDSGKYEAVLRKYRVDLWLCGHTHFPSSLGLNEIVSKEFKTLFINIAAMRKDYSISNIESRLITFTNNSDSLIVFDRYHDEGKFENARTIEYRLSHKAVWQDKKNIMKPYRE